MIIDIHAHVFPDALAARAVAFLAQQAQIPAFTDGTCAALRESMRRAGIDLSVLAPIATKPAQARSINAWIAETNRAFPDLVGFGTLHPAQEDWAQEIERLVADGIRGVKLHPDYQEFFVDEARMLPIYRMLADAGLMVLMHAGVDVGLPGDTHCPPERLARVLDAVPQVTMIASHMGAWRQWEGVERCLAGRDLYFDTSYSLAEMGADLFLRILRAHGAERVLFGTDSPWSDQSAEIEAFHALPLTAAEKEAVLGGNASRLLGLVEA